MRSKLETFLKGEGFNQSTLNMLDDSQLADLAAEYKFEQ